ncbi:hypothetical protein LY76DRAFT_247242 [Colletotrichum caudatum]|nr:hypothetical protein LY76DRAFT_247242 [Colletotrichum caudatum]
MQPSVRIQLLPAGIQKLDVYLPVQSTDTGRAIHTFPHHTGHGTSVSMPEGREGKDVRPSVNQPGIRLRLAATYNVNYLVYYVHYIVGCRQVGGALSVPAYLDTLPFAPCLHRSSARLFYRTVTYCPLVRHTHTHTHTHTHYDSKLALVVVILVLRQPT